MLEPTSPGSLSTVTTSSSATFSCLPPQRTIAYTRELSLSLRAPAHRCLHGGLLNLHTESRSADDSRPLRVPDLGVFTNPARFLQAGAFLKAGAYLQAGASGRAVVGF